MVNDDRQISASRIDMEDLELLADARFASLFAPTPARKAMINLWRLQGRFAAVQAYPEEPHIPLIRLAWWRDALDGLNEREVKGEPLLEALSETVPVPAISAAAALAEAHMDRIEAGGEQHVRAALTALGIALLGEGNEKPFLAPLAAAPVRDRSPTRRHLAMIAYMIRGRLPAGERVSEE